MCKLLSGTQCSLSPAHDSASRAHYCTIVARLLDVHVHAHTHTRTAPFSNTHLPSFCHLLFHSFFPFNQAVDQLFQAHLAAGADPRAFNPSATLQAGLDLSKVRTRPQHTIILFRFHKKRAIRTVYVLFFPLHFISPWLRPPHAPQLWACVVDV